ncbi:MAG TPA: FAD-binding oxidoreductase [Spirochaetota bacterium]|nr:FAD-binding oxidoreductase [Spirochaetota bacterium]HPI21872.1 FAD-binding oxidoreductase [Spirochaetota bacterium]HPU87681.1 FAD-binding oxidoreductase [Spirochaetota bacterium]
MYGNYRHIFKWGDPSHEEQLKDHVVHFAKEHFGMTDADFANKHLPGFDTITLKKRPRLSKASLGALKKIVGAENVSTEDFERAYHSAGKFYLELLKLRLGVIDNPPDAVVYPRDEKDVIAIVRLCNAKRIPITPFGGHSSVTRGVEPVKGGISLDLTRHMNAVIRVNEINSTVTVQPGMFGPALEEFLNRYKAGYTCGHFPQSFEFSTVGGWAVTRGAGQASTGYGKIEDMVLSMRTVTPAGIIETKDYPAAAIGPDIDQIIIGSEGAYGVVTEITMKIRTYRPQNTSHTSFVFKDFKSAVTAMRTVMQAEFGKPHLFRISDPEETEMAFRMGGKHGGLGDKVLSLLGYKPMQRCLMFVSVEGDANYTKFVVGKIKDVASDFGALCTGAGPTKKWLEQRYSSAYLRDPLMDAGILADTLETSVSWENLNQLWSEVRDYIKARPKTVCMVHLSHIYENGANLYFTFLTPMNKGDEVRDFVQFHKGIVDTVHANHGSISHHHGVGKMLAPWMPKEHDTASIELMRAIKKHLDPKGIMNPGTLGL